MIFFFRKGGGLVAASELIVGVPLEVILEPGPFLSFMLPGHPEVSCSVTWCSTFLLAQITRDQWSWTKAVETTWDAHTLRSIWLFPLIAVSAQDFLVASVSKVSPDVCFQDGSRSVILRWRLVIWFQKGPQYLIPKKAVLFAYVAVIKHWPKAT